VFTERALNNGGSVKNVIVKIMIVMTMLVGNVYALENHRGLGVFLDDLKKLDDDALAFLPELLEKPLMYMNDYDEQTKEEFVSLIIDEMQAWNHKFSYTYKVNGGLDAIKAQLMEQSYVEICNDINTLSKKVKISNKLHTAKTLFLLPAYLVAIILDDSPSGD